MSAAARRLIPLADRVLVKRLAAMSQTKSGLYLPESATGKSNEAEVVAVGPGGRDRNGELITPAVKAGDRVLLPEYGGHEITLGDDKMYLFRHDDILGKYE